MARLSLKELGFYGYAAGFEPATDWDPNDGVRQRTQSRAQSYPYDTRNSYGEPQSVDMGGGAYDDGGLHRPLTPKYGEDEHQDEAAGTPVNILQSFGDGEEDTVVSPAGKTRGFAGSSKPDLDLPESWGIDEDCEGEVDLSFVEDIDLHECFAVHRGPGPPGTGWSSLLELLDSEDRG